MVLTEQLQEPQDGLHDGDSWSHLRVHLPLLCRWLDRQGGGALDGGDGLALDQQRVTGTRKDQCCVATCTVGGGYGRTERVWRRDSPSVVRWDNKDSPFSSSFSLALCVISPTLTDTVALMSV